MPEEITLDDTVIFSPRMQGRKISRGLELRNIPKPDPLISDLLDLNSTGVLYGGWGQGKSLLALALSLCIATGQQWEGCDVKSGTVLYFVGEGYSGFLSDRQDAWLAHHHISLDPDVNWVDGIPPILNPKGEAELLNMVAVIQPTLTVIDTVARATAGKVENDFETMSSVVEVLDKIRRASNGGCALGVHHSGRGEDVHMRGHSSFDAGVDTILRFHNDDLYVEKQRYHQQGYTWGTFEKLPVNNSVVAHCKSRPSPFTPNEEKILAALDALGGESTYLELKNASKARKVSEGSFDRVLRGLKGKGVMVAGDGRDGSPSYRRA